MGIERAIAIGILVFVFFFAVIVGLRYLDRETVELIYPALGQ